MVRGSEDPHAAARAVRSGFASYRSCYEALLSRSPQAKVDLVARLSVAPSGTVTDAAFDQRVGGDDEFVACLASALRRLALTAQPSGAAATQANVGSPAAQPSQASATSRPSVFEVPFTFSPD
ncbi:MAG TPA: hypothetical protein VLC09_08710 [Polyangiaceae bacterium]|nr:hypothetical protein [Polyangiaceae bacterium]